MASQQAEERAFMVGKSPPRPEQQADKQKLETDTEICWHTAGARTETWMGFILLSSACFCFRQPAWQLKVSSDSLTDSDEGWGQTASIYVRKEELVICWYLIYVMMVSSYPT